MWIRVAIVGTILFIAIIDKLFKIIAILSVIGDNFSKVTNTVAEVIFVLFYHYIYVSRYAPIFCTLHSSMAAFFVEDVSNDLMKGV